MVMYSSQMAQQIMLGQASIMGGAPATNILGATTQGTGGVYGEQVAMRMAGTGRTAMGVAGMGLGVAGMFTSMPLDPISGAISGARMGMGMGGGFVGGALGAGIGMLPFYAMGKAADVYGGAFFGGMQQQGALNQTLRNNFSFYGGQGAYGRGFSQGQMGQIGGMVSSEMRQSPFTSSAEMNQLLSMGADSGMFTAVRDVQQFAQRFKTMISSLRKIQETLGGSLTDAMQLTRQMQGLGIYNQGSRMQFASEMRDTMATTGMGQDQLVALAAQGSMMSRATGGFGRQGAIGALRVARTLGSALNTGAINREMLTEATGLTGDEAIQAFSGRILAQSERLSRRGMGRFSIFAMSNADATGLDQDAVDRFLAGDISTSDVSQRAHRNVNRMGRARAMNREGMLRGSLMEQGGLAAHVGMMRLMVGDRVMDQGDDLASLVMQRRFGMERGEAETWIGMMRNQSSIAQAETVDRSLSKRETSLRQDVATNRSMDAFMDHLQHGLQDATGVTAVRSLGRNFLTKISSMAERALNDVLGISASALSTTDRQSIQRLGMGMANREDLERLQLSGAGRSGYSGVDVFQRPLAQRILGGLGMHSAESVGETMMRRGIDMRGMTAQQRDAALRAVERAQSGVVTGADAAGLSSLLSDKGASISKLVNAEALAAATGDASMVYRAMGVSANAVDAFRRKNGIEGAGLTPNMASLLGQGKDLLAGNLTGIGIAGWKGSAMGRSLGSIGGPLGSLFGGLIGGVAGGAMEAMRSLGNDQDNAIGFLARGGHLVADAKQITELAHTGLISDLDKATALTDKGLGFSTANAFSKFKGMDEGRIKTLTDSGDFQSGIRRLQALKGDPKRQEAELRRMELAMLKGPDREAGAMLMRQLRYNIKNMKGSVGNEFTGAIKLTEREQEIMREFEGMGSQYAGVAELLGNSAFGKQISGISDAFYGYSGDVNKQVQGLQDKLAGLDPNSAEYREVAKALGTTEVGRGLLQGVAGIRAFEKDATGRGRRGGAQQAETLFGAFTGGSMGSLDFSIGGRALSKRNQAQVLMREFSKGGKNAQDLEVQLATQLEQMGVADATDKVQKFREILAGGVTGDEARDLYRKLQSDPDLERVRRQGVEKMQRDRDPLGVERNDLLKGILEGVKALRPEGGVNMSEG